MKKNETKQERPQALKRKLMSALAMLLVSTILMTTTSYAWFVLSTAPEVTGIETQVGANGSLEIALLNTETRTDMSKIRSGVMGDSLAAGQQSANNAWGNLVDLGYENYGLGQILLMPARLNAVGNAEDGYTVDPGMLAIPTYGYDGRVIDLDDNTISAVYQGSEFSFVSGVQDYGVRAIGTSDAVTAQESALSNAKGNIPTYTKTARENAAKALENHGDTVFTIMLNHMSNDAYVYDNEDRDALRTLLQDLQKSISDIDVAMRQGVVAYAASELGDEDTFNTVKDKILDNSKSLKTILEELPEVGSLPEEFATWVDDLHNMSNDLNLALNKCAEMTSGAYTWDEIRGVLNYVMNVDGVYIDDDLFSQVDQSELMDKAMAGNEITMTLGPGSGIFASIADFADNYNSSMKAMGMVDIFITTASAESPSHLKALAIAVNTLDAASGGNVAVEFPLSATYGYALDLAFRCNAANPDLVLQTKGVQRVYSDSESTSTQGGGSYMEFTSSDETLTTEQRLLLMDAIRVGFTDDQGKLLAVGKLNVSNYVLEDGMLNAPLYLYEYSFSEEDGSMIMGERRLTDNLITTLQQNVAKAVTVVVWLDGDLVDNSMVSATEAASLSGVLNLQFATTADLIPATDGMLMNYTADMTGLLAAVEAYRTTLNEGQTKSENGKVTYTNVSWNEFSAAFSRAVEVSENTNASAIEVNNALRTLITAASGLKVVSKDTINQEVAELRNQMGTVTGEVGSLIIRNADGSYSAVGNDEHTQEVHDSWEIVGEVNRVDYESNNLLDKEANPVPKYSDETWNALAQALYQAEAVAQNPDATEDQINDALTALDIAEKALTRQVFFTPYEYRGTIYYEAICDADKEDTYGKWYDSEFNRIVSDVTILNLDAYAEPTAIIEMGQDAYVYSDVPYITPDVAFLEQVFPELRDVQVKAVRWVDIDTGLFTELMSEAHYTKLAELVAIHDSAELSAVVTDTTIRDGAVALIAQYEAGTDIQVEYAKTTITQLNAQIVALYEAAALKAEEDSTLMTSNQTILLTAAVNAAKAVDDYDDPESITEEEQKAKVETLIAKTEAAEALLANGGTKEDATTALAELNDALNAVDEDAISEYNTLTHKLPEGFGAGDVVYEVDYPGLKLKLTGNTGVTALKAHVLTEDGVVIEVTKEITICAKPDAVTVAKDGIAVESLGLSVGGSANLTAALYYAAEDAVRDKIKEINGVEWSSTNTTAVTVTNGNVNAVAAGAAEINVTVYTMAGGIYTVSIPVIVTE